LENKSHTSKVLNRWYNFRFKLFAEGILSGLIAGILVVVFLIMIDEAELLRGRIYSFLNMSSIPVIMGWFLVLILIGYVLGKIVEKEPMTAGSGVSQTEGVLAGHLKMSW